MEQQLNSVSKDGLENPSFEMSENEEGTPIANQLSNRGHRRISPDSTVNDKKVSLDLENDVQSSRDNSKDSGGVTESGWEDPVSKLIVGFRSGITSVLEKNKPLVKKITIFLLFLAYNGYIVTAIAYAVRNENPIAWCDGLGFLLIGTGIVYWSLFYYFILKGYFGTWIEKNIGKPLESVWNAVFSLW
jgi:hypothetical protein